MAEAAHTASRRGVIGALALAAAAGGATFAVMPAGASRDRSAWDRKMAAVAAAKKAMRDYERTELTPREQAVGPMPDKSFKITASSGHTATFPVDITNPSDWSDHCSAPYRAAAAEVHASWQRYRAACERVGMQAASDRYEELAAKYDELENALFETPAPDGPALLWKADLLFGPDHRDSEGFSVEWCSEWLDIFLADARRLLAGGIN